MEEAEPPPSYLTTLPIAEIATRGLFGEGLSQLEILELCEAVLCEIARLRRLNLTEEASAHISPRDP